MKILCIGGSGYIGSELVDELSQSHSVESVDIGWFGVYGVQKQLDYNELSKDYLSSFDVVILTAAHSSVPMCNEDKKGAFQNNILNFKNLVEKLNPTQKFIYASSSCVYLTGFDATENLGLIPNDMLSFSKTTTDNYLQAFNPCEWYALRFGSVNGFSKNFRTDLMINAMTLNGMASGSLKVFNGNNYRPILGMKDLTRGVRAIVENKEDKRGVYNMASFNVKIGDVAKEVSDTLGCSIEDTGTSPSYDFTINSSKFISALGFEFKETTRSIVEALQQNKNYLVENKFLARKGIVYV
jgi:nucleoside-diphosphate-sugar epimerase